jgi:hypothetical protein
MTIQAITAAAVLFAGTTSVNAATFNFDFTFDGTDVSQNAGSDTPDGTVLDVGDLFIINLLTAGSDFWKVDGEFSQFVPMSFAVSAGAIREAFIKTTWLLDGVVQNMVSETVFQEYFHVGSQSWDLSDGLMFDQVILEWEFLSIDDFAVLSSSAETVINASGADIFEDFSSADRPFFRDPQVTYVAAVVPLPASLPLLAAALGLIGIVRKRRLSPS